MKTIKSPIRSPKAQRREIIVAGVASLICGGFAVILTYFYVTDPAVSGIFTLIMAGFFGLITIWFGSGMLRAFSGMRNARLLDEKGIETRGTVLKVTQSNPSPGDWRYYMTYTFSDDLGEQYQCEARIQPATFTKYSAGSAITVRYMPYNPTIHRPEY